MSTFVARSSKQIARDILAKVVTNLGGLNIDEGGPETAIIGAVAEEMALHEAKRRTKKAKPPASAVIQVLNELGFKLVAS